MKLVLIFFADNDQLSQHFVSESFVFQEGVQTVRFLCETSVLSSALTLVCKAYVETQSQKKKKNIEKKDKFLVI